MLFTLVLVGGATRVTDSGLSITEWEPIIGVLPPITFDSWMIEFEKYKLIPEYTLINYQMSLSEFKVIYLWERGHQILVWRFRAFFRKLRRPFRDPFKTERVLRRRSTPDRF